MRRLARVLPALAVAALAAGLPAGALAATAVPGLVYTPGYGNSMVALLDPLTSRRTGAAVRLGGNASSWAYSPQSRYLAIASYPQTLGVIDVTTMRLLGRVRLAAAGGIVHGITWARRDRMLAVVDTPRGALVVAVDPFSRHVMARTQLRRPATGAFARVPGGVAFLLGARGRLARAAIAVVDADGLVRVAAVPRLRVGVRATGSGRAEVRFPGLAVDPLGRRGYLVGEEGVFVVDLRTLAVARSGPLRSLAKAVVSTYRSAAWIGDGLVAVSGADQNAGARTPYGLRVLDVRRWTLRMVDPTASSFARAGRLLLVEQARDRRALEVTAYDVLGRVRYRTRLAGVTWMKKGERLGYACRDAMLRAVVDLRSGTVLRRVPPGAAIRCLTVLSRDSAF